MSRRYRPFDPFERGGPFDPGAPGREIRFPRVPRRFWVAVALFVLAVLIFIATSPIVAFITEFQWYDALGYKDVYQTRVWLEWSITIASFALAFVYLAVNAAIALRIRSGGALRAVGIRRSALRTTAGTVSLVACVLIALVLSAGAFSQWQSWALFLHSESTGTTDPVLGMDVSFYLLTLPFLHAVANWSLGLDFLTLLLIGALYAWRGDAFDFRPSPRSLAHLSVLVAAFAVTLSVATWLSRYDLLFTHNTNVVWGAAYTDVNARLPVYTLQAALGIVFAAGLLANAWLRRLWVPIVAVLGWIALSFASQVYPSIVQGVTAGPNAGTLELPYIARSIDFTRRAYGLSDVTGSTSFTGDQPLTLQDVQNDQATINNLRLWDYTPLKDTYQQQQAIRTYYTFNDIDLDRYTVNGQYQQLEISAREFDFSRLQSSSQNWFNQRLVYTHGYGTAASPVNAVVGEGLPDYVVHDVPPIGPLKITQPAIYFGEMSSTNGDYCLVASSTKEFDYPLGGTDVFTTYKGTHGVPMTPLNKALWSLKLSDFSLLVSGQVTDKTLMLYRRNILDRASEIAPFLTFDSDPYIVVVDGRLYWILDAYTTASTYPYSQAQTIQVQGSATSINYIRNSVKVVIDAYEGTANFYVADSKDPLLRAYEATFPSLFQPLDAMPAGIKAHIRVPEDLFSVQVSVYTIYHMTDPKVFFSQEDAWDVPTGQSSPGSAPLPVQPYYVLFRLPGEQNPEFLLIMPFTPHNKTNLVSWLAARNDGSHYGQYVLYSLPKDRVIYGPQQVASFINQDPTISRDFTLLHSTGSQVQQGNLLVVPIGNSFLYFEPVYLRATTATGIPELKKVILADQNNVVYADTLDQAIQQLVGAAPPPVNNQPPPSTYTAAQVAQIQSLVTQINQHYKAAYDALKRGDLATFATEMNTVGTLLAQLQAVTGTASTPATSPSPSPSARASPSP
ncbi:MAG TPA: UPF0182 family protein [Candidatus Dormibacteraeota bacterium]|nr:UPF0182 family protein [Candidatus Dormibacteraeota bacterium]